MIIRKIDFISNPSTSLAIRKYGCKKMAKKLKVSQAYVSYLVNDKKPISEAKYAQILRILSLGVEEE